MSLSTRTSEVPRWPIERLIVDKNEGWDPHPDDVFYLGGASRDDVEFDLWMLRWNAADPSDPAEVVIAVVSFDEERTTDMDGEPIEEGDELNPDPRWSLEEENISTIDYQSSDLLQEGKRRSIMDGFTKDASGSYEFDARRSQGGTRKFLPEKGTEGTEERDHRADALFLGTATHRQTGLVLDLYIVPRVADYDDFDGKTEDRDARVYAAHSHACGTIDGWWEDGSIPNTASIDHFGLREAMRRAWQQEIDFNFDSKKMEQYNRVDGVEFPKNYDRGAETIELITNLKPNQSTDSEEELSVEETTSMSKPSTVKTNVHTPENKKFKNVSVVRAEDEQIHLPVGMSLSSARKWLETIEQNEEQVIQWSEIIDAYPLDGALALNHVLQARFGGAVKTGATGWFGMEIPPFMVSIEVGVGKTEHVPWGYFVIPTMPEHKIEAGIEMKNGQLFFKLSGDIKKKYQSLMDEIATQVREELKGSSVYKGQAFRLTFPTEKELNSENYNPHDYAPKFINVARSTDKLIFSKGVRQQIQVNLFTPVLHTAMCRKHGIPLKRGVLLAGKYGTGKTLTASVLSKLCVENGWTFIYLNNVADLEKAMRFAKRYEPAVIFAEDIDSVMQQKDGSARDAAMNAILNTIDGVDMKNAEQMVVLTSNFAEKINKAMLRPGRLDAVILVEPPDAEAAIELFRNYSHGLLDGENDTALMPAAELMAGQIPSVIREVTERSKLAAIDRSATEGTELTGLKGSDVLTAAQGIAGHVKMLADPPVDTRSDIEKGAQVIADALVGKTANGSGKGHHVPAVTGKGLSGVSES